MATLEKPIKSEQKFAGALVRSVSCQFGINRNPSICSIQVVGNPSFTANSIGNVYHFKLGSISFYGLLESWEKVEKDVKGKDVYDVKLVDLKPLLEKLHVYLNGGYELGDGVLELAPQTVNELRHGIPWKRVVSEIDGRSVPHQGSSFTIDIDLPVSTVNGQQRLAENAVMSVLDVVEQIARDEGVDWYLDSSRQGLHVKAINRTKSGKGSGLDAIAAKHTGHVIRLRKGWERRDFYSRVILVGANQQKIEAFSGTSLHHFWGYTETGDLADSPQFDIIDTGGTTSYSPSLATLTDALNGDLSDEDYTPEEQEAYRAYANENWGRKFYITLSSTVIDDDGHTWVDPVSGGWGDPGISPHDKLQTDDGRWVCFVKLPSITAADPPQVAGYRIAARQWFPSLLISPNVVKIGNSWYLKAKAAKYGNKIIVTLPTTLRVEALYERQPTAESRNLEAAGEVDPRPERIVKHTNVAEIAGAWVPIVHYRQVYGPWSHGDQSGRTTIIIDNTLAPWTAGGSLAEMDKIATAKLKALIDKTEKVGTGLLEVAGLPRVNLGTYLAERGNITNISVNFGIDGVRTIYKAQTFTTELGRYRRAQDDLLGEMRNEGEKFYKTQYPRATNNFAINSETRSLSRHLPDSEVGGPLTDAQTQAQQATEDAGGLGDGFGGGVLDRFLARVVARASDNSPQYRCIRQIAKRDVWGGITYQDATVFQFVATNLSEPPGRAGRLAFGAGTYAGRLTSHVRSNVYVEVELTTFAQPITVVGDGSDIIPQPDIQAHVFSQQVQRPMDFTATIDNAIGNARYQVTPVNAGIDLLLGPDELHALDSVENVGEPGHSPGYLRDGEQVRIQWNENVDGSWTPYIEKQINLFVIPEGEGGALPL